MRISRSRYVVDSSVLISLEHGNLIEAVFKLKHSFSTTDLIFEELGGEFKSILSFLRLKIERLNHLDMERMEHLVLKYRKPSRIDISGLILSEEKGAVLLTGDNNLRNAEQDERIEVHGALFLMNAVVDQGIILPDTAIKALDRMILCNNWLPKKECEMLRFKWSKRRTK